MELLKYLPALETSLTFAAARRSPDFGTNDICHSSEKIVGATCTRYSSFEPAGFRYWTRVYTTAIVTNVPAICVPAENGDLCASISLAHKSPGWTVSNLRSSV